MADDNDVKKEQEKKSDRVLLIRLLEPLRYPLWALRVLTGAIYKQLEKLRKWYYDNR